MTMRKSEIEKTCRLIRVIVLDLQKRIGTSLTSDVWQELIYQELLALDLDVKLSVCLPNQRVEYALQRSWMADLLVNDCIAIYLEKGEHTISQAELYVSTLLYFVELPCGVYIHANEPNWSNSWQVVWNERVLDSCLTF
jgi:hypothetical protein